MSLRIAVLQHEHEELDRATPALDALAEQLIDRWLDIVSGVAAVERPRSVAVDAMQRRECDRVEATRPIDELTVTLWCAAVLFGVLLAAYWFAGAIYSN